MRYVNLDIEAFDYAREEGREKFSVRVAASHVGEQKITDAEPVMLPADLRTRLRLLESRRLNVAQTIAFGEDLAAALLPPRARLFFTRSLERLRDDEALRVRLKLDTLSLVDLPWEYVYVAEPDTPANHKGPGGFLVLNRRLSLVRYEVIGQAQGQLGPVGDESLRVVSIMANPADTPELHLDAERELMERALSGMTRVKVEFYPDATVDTLLDALSRDAHIFHFAGHGRFESELGESFGSLEGQGYLSLVGENGEEHRFPSGTLALNLRHRNVRLAVLGACEAGRRDSVNAWTGVVPALTLAGIPAVIGMQMTIRDRSAIAFTQRMYQALADGKSVDEAVAVGRIAIFSRATEPDERDWGVPVLYHRAEEGVLFPKAAEATMTAGGPIALAATPSAGSATAEPKTDTRALRTALVNSFSREELDALCFDLQEELRSKGLYEGPINLEVVGGSGKTAMVLNLIQYLERRKLLPHMVELVRSSRPGIV
ncbi:MAG TPA: CHAT domain-containing protein [Pyrinomonadaceae bacterium]|jgi:hypothetical protein